MNTTHDSTTIELTFQVEVVYRKERYVYGADADGNRGVMVEEYIPERAEVVEQGLPPEVEAWLKTAAIEQFERERGGMMAIPQGMTISQLERLALKESVRLTEHAAAQFRKLCAEHKLDNVNEGTLPYDLSRTLYRLGDWLMALAENDRRA